MSFQKTEKNKLEVDAVANRVTTGLFSIYLILLCWILLLKLGTQFPYSSNRRVNLIPFSEPLILNGKTDVGEMILNVLIFLPVGIYTGTLFQKWRFGKKVLFTFFLSLTVELLQFLLAIGSFDSTDIITNTTGGLLGIVIVNGLEKAFSNPLRTQRFVNMLAAVATILMILFLTLLKLNLLPVRYQ